MENQEKRGAVIAAMMGVVAEYGFHGAPMALVAERAGVGAGTIYRYFESKDDLIVACFYDIEQRYRAAVLTEYPEGRPVRERFLYISTRMLRYMVDNPREFSFLQQFRDSPYGSRHLSEWMLGRKGGTELLDLFREAQQLQIVKNLPLPILMALMFGPYMTICRDHIAGLITLDDDLIDAVARACWDGLKR